MKKYFISIIFVLLLYGFLSFNIVNSNKEEYIPVMSELRTYNLREEEYELTFDEEVLNLSNFKLKMALFSSLDCDIKKIYINYPNKVKEYFDGIEYISVTGNNLNDIVDIVRNKYISILKNNNLYDNEFVDNNISINKVIIQGGAEVMDRFRIKYPKVKIVIK